MACGCKKRRVAETTQPTTTSTPQTINTTLAESTNQNLTETQQVIVDKIVDKLNQINKDLL